MKINDHEIEDVDDTRFIEKKSIINYHGFQVSRIYLKNVSSTLASQIL